MSEPIIRLTPTDNPRRWVLPVRDDLCTGPVERTFLFGGSGLAGCIAALRTADPRPVIWTTVQYVAYARPGEMLAFDVIEVARGRQTVQLQVTGRVGDRVVVMAQGALGERPGQPFRQLTSAQPKRPPEACPRAPHRGSGSRGVHANFEFRLIRGRYPTLDEPFDGPGDGRLSLWVRPRRNLTLDAPLIGIVADYVSEALSDANGRYVHASSIDNTVRFGVIEPSEWLLCEIAIDALNSGVGHGQMRIYSQAGLLMALASTSLIVRTPRSAAHATASSPAVGALVSSGETCR